MKKVIKAVILAAGKSRRMKSKHSKMVHKILGKEIINYLLDSILESGIPEENITIVVGQNREEIQGVVKRKVTYAVQKEQLGTAHALLAADEFFKDHDGDLLVTVGDNPYITAPELKKLIQTHQENRYACTFISAVFPDTPPPYGRVIRDESGSVTDVVEEIDASKDQLKLREVNSSIYMFSCPVTTPLLYKIDNRNRKNEYYLTDIIKLLNKGGEPIGASIADDFRISIGINHKWELQEAQSAFNREKQKYMALHQGVTFLQPETITVEQDVEIGQDTVIYPSTYIGRGTRIGKDCRIGPFAYLRNVEISDGESVSYEKKIRS
jgi:bifunctional UDP-N-acetylglucosamine pyrophosphorylase/glucosamine-1-phosphate N-acetyltransferase